MFTCTVYQKLKSATIDQVPDILNLPKRKDREPLPPQAENPSQAVPNTMTTNSTVTAGNDSQGYTHLDQLGYPMHPVHVAQHALRNLWGLQGFPPASGFPMQTPAYPYPMPNYPGLMYAPPYGYPFAPPQGPGASATHATSTMQPNGFPAPPSGSMQNYHMPNYPMPTPMYAPQAASGYPFAMPAPAAPPGLPGLGQLEGANVDSGRKRQFSVSDPQASSGPIEAGFPGPNTDPTFNDWLNDTVDTGGDQEA